jgi:hypothetical protein
MSRHFRVTYVLAFVNYGLQWFVDEDFNQVLINEMESIKNLLFERYGVWFAVILWPPVAPW